MADTRHITLPKGFRATGVKAGIKPSGREDVALLAAEADCSAAVVLTSNQVFGAPIAWARRILPRGRGKLRAFVINSGCSNVCTGPAGLRDAEEMAARTARRLVCDARKVLVASTGVIGHRLPMDKVRAGIDAAAEKLSTRHDGDFLRAIMTTDLREKSAVVVSKLGRTKFTVAGTVKGSGMIAPSLATMIAPITTDAAVSPALLHKALKDVAGRTFNAVTVDSDQSTSDTVAVLASGASGNASIRPGSKEYRKFLAVLEEVCGALAYQLAADGEGATRVIRIAVTGARGEADARAAAMSVANSPLVKTAVHGSDPNWGRIVMALGKSAAKVEPDKLKVRIGRTLVFSAGRGRKFDEKTVSTYLSGKEVDIACDLGLGEGAFAALTCDLSREYIAINADYTT